MDDTIILVSEETAKDTTGQRYRQEVQTGEILCELDSVTRTEWSTAYQAGYESEYKVTVFHLDYAGQKTAIFHDARYAVYRTFRKGERMELYLGTRVGDIDGDI